MKSEMYKPEAKQGNLFGEKAERIIGDIQLVAEGKKEVGFLEANGYSDLDKLFFQESPPVLTEAPKDSMLLGAENSIRQFIESLAAKEERSKVENEVLEKLSVYFQGLSQRSEYAERTSTAVAFLEEIPVDSSLRFLSELSRDPLGTIEGAEKKVLRRDDPKLNSLAREGKSAEEVSKEYFTKIIKPQALRSVIRLKQQMGVELTEDEKNYYAEHQEKF